MKRSSSLYLAVGFVVAFTASIAVVGVDIRADAVLMALWFCTLVLGAILVGRGTPDSSPDSSPDSLLSVARSVSARFEQADQMATWSRITSDLMAVADISVPIPRRKFDWVNDAWTRELGWDKQTLCGSFITDILHPDDVHIVVEKRATAEAEPVNNGATVAECRVLCQPKEGEEPDYRFFEWTSLVLDGKLYITGRDIEHERAHHDEMQHVIEDLEARNRDLERFASVAAHQLRSPPRTIAGIAQALKEDYGDLLDREGQQFLEDIRSDADQMAEIVDGLYRFSKVRTSESLVVEPVDLNEVLRTVELQRSKKRCASCPAAKTCPTDSRPQRCSLRSHEVIFDNLPVVLGDKLLLTEVFANLVENGFKFNESENKRVRITAELYTDNRWHITVRDNGIGIDPKYQPKLFTMFQRVHTGYAGTGVGLALVSAIVGKLGGGISVESDVGQGTAFTFDLAAAWG